MSAFAALAAGATAFNLICTGVETNSTNPDEHSYSRTFRIDLNRGRWCADDCRETAPIVRVTLEEITLAQVDTTAVQGFMKVSRESGELVSVSRGEYRSYVTAHCERADFTGFPAARF